MTVKQSTEKDEVFILGHPCSPARALQTKPEGFSLAGSFRVRGVQWIYLQHDGEQRLNASAQREDQTTLNFYLVILLFYPVLSSSPCYSNQDTHGHLRTTFIRKPFE